MVLRTSQVVTPDLDRIFTGAWSFFFTKVSVIKKNLTLNQLMKMVCFDAIKPESLFSVVVIKTLLHNLALKLITQEASPMKVLFLLAAY
jgi:hypothetical protein